MIWRPARPVQAREKLERLVAEAIATAGSKVTARELLDALYDDYREFRRMKRTKEWPKL